MRDYKKQNTISLSIFSIICVFFAVSILHSLVVIPISAQPSVTNVYSEGERTITFTTNVLKEKFGTIGLNDQAKVFGVISFLLGLLFAFVGVISVVLLSVWGTQMIYSQMTGGVTDIIKAQNHLKDIVIGVIILLTSWIVLQFVSPTLLQPNFSGAKIERPMISPPFSPPISPPKEDPCADFDQNNKIIKSMIRRGLAPHLERCIEDVRPPAPKEGGLTVQQIIEQNRMLRNF